MEPDIDEVRGEAFAGRPLSRRVRDHQRDAEEAGMAHFKRVAVAKPTRSFQMFIVRSRKRQNRCGIARQQRKE
jgi:hypothetical protein